MSLEADIILWVLKLNEIITKFLYIMGILNITPLLNMHIYLHVYV